MPRPLTPAARAALLGGAPAGDPERAAFLAEAVRPSRAVADACARATLEAVAGALAARPAPRGARLRRAFGGGRRGHWLDPSPEEERDLERRFQEMQAETAAHPTPPPAGPGDEELAERVAELVRLRGAVFDAAFNALLSAVSFVVDNRY